MKENGKNKKKADSSFFVAFFAAVIDWAGIIIFALIIALFINNVIITNSFIPTPSMESNLPVGSRLFGFRLNYLFTDIKRGDVVIFDYGYTCKDCKEMYQKNDEKCCPICRRPDNKNKKAHFIKRVIGLPGEHIEIKADYTAEQDLFRDIKFQNPDIKATCGHVYINGEVYDEPYLNEPMIVNKFFGAVDVVVPENCYYLLGDNRNNSEDARFWPNPFINKKDIEAKAYILYWPLNKIGLIK